MQSFKMSALWLKMSFFQRKLSSGRKDYGGKFFSQGNEGEKYDVVIQGKRL